MKPRPRIAFLTTSLARGGAEAQVAQLALRLSRHGYEPVVVSLLEPVGWAKDLEQAGIPVIAPGLSRIPSVLRGLRPDILHCHMFHANVVGRFLRLVLPFPVVISTIHSLAESSQRSRTVRLRDLLYRFTDTLADVSVAVSAAVAARHLEAKAASPKRMRVIHNGVDTGWYRYRPEIRQAIRGQLGLGDEFVWLAAGRLMWKKDYPTLLAAFSRLDRGILLIAGDGPEESRLRQSAGARVRFLGARQDLPELLNGADAFVLSSVVEGLPTVLLEASACELPSVATDVGGVAEIGTSLLAPPGEVNALHAQMQRLMLLDADALRQMGREARERVCEAFDFETITVKWEQLYSELWT